MRNRWEATEPPSHRAKQKKLKHQNKDKKSNFIMKILGGSL